MSEPEDDFAAPFVMGVPSKGRLQENAQAFFASAGLEFVKGRGERDYRGAIAGFAGVEIAFLSASDIIGGLIAGALHFGVSGEDLLREASHRASGAVALLAPLGFGQAHVVVAVPKAWIDVATMADLADVASLCMARHGRRLRVATKYIALTQAFFAAHHISDYLIVESFGATEGAPAAGQADVIVDITTTGATLAANALKTLHDGTILRSRANLMAARGAMWGKAQRESARRLLMRVEAAEFARTHKLVRFMLGQEGHSQNGNGQNGHEAIAQLAATMRAQFGAVFPFGLPPQDGGESAPRVITALSPQSRVLALCEFLNAAGAYGMVVESAQAVFLQETTLYPALCAFLDGA